MKSTKITKKTELAEIANFIVEKFYRKAMRAASGAFNNEDTESVKRKNHGGMHVSRVAALVNVFFNLYKIYDPRTDLINDNILKMLMIAAMFHDAGRSNDTGNDSKEDEKNSSSMAKEFLIELGYDKEISNVISLAIKYKDQIKERNGNFELLELERGELGLPKLQLEYPNEQESDVGKQEQLRNCVIDGRKLLYICVELLHDADCLDVLRADDWVFSHDYLLFYQKFVNPNKNERAKELLAQVVAAHANALVAMGDLPRGYINKKMDIKIDPCFSIEKKATYEHSGNCYSEVVTTLCNQAFFARYYTDFVGYEVQEAGSALAEPGEKTIIGSDKINGLELLAVDYRHYASEDWSSENYITEYYSDANNLDPDGHQIRHNVFVSRYDSRSPEMIKRQGGFNPRVTRLKTADIEGIDYKRNGVLDVAKHRKGGDRETVAPSSSGLVSFSFFMSKTKLASYNQYILFAPWGISYSGCSSNNSSAYVNEQELTAPGGFDWGQVVAYRAGNTIFIRRAVIALNSNMFTQQLCQNLLRNNEAIVLLESKNDSGLLAKVQGLCEQHKGDFSGINNILIYNENIKSMLQEICASDADKLAVFVVVLIKAAHIYRCENQEIIQYTHIFLETLLQSDGSVDAVNNAINALTTSRDVALFLRCIAMSSLSPEQQQHFKQRVLAIVMNDGEGLHEVLRGLQTGERDVALDFFRDELGSIVFNATRLWLALKKISASQRDFLLETLNDNVCEIFANDDCYYLDDILGLLNENGKQNEKSNDHVTLLLSRLKDKFYTIFTNSRCKLNFVLQKLNDDQKALIHEGLRGHWVELFCDAHVDVCGVIEQFSAEKRRSIFDEVRGSFGKVFTENWSLSLDRILGVYDEASGKELLEELDVGLREIINSYDKLKLVLSVPNETQKRTVLKLLGSEHLVGILTTKPSWRWSLKQLFGNLLQDLTPNLKDYMLKALTPDGCRSVIKKCPSCVINVLNQLNEQQVDVLYKALKGHFRSIFNRQSGVDQKELLSKFSMEQQKSIEQEFKSSQAKAVKSCSNDEGLSQAMSSFYF